MISTREWRTFWLAPAGVPCFHAQFARHAFERHVHAEFVIVLIEAGTEACYHRGEVQYAGPGGLGLVNPGAVHSGRPEGEAYRYRALYPDAELMRRTSADLTGVDEIPYFTKAVFSDAETAAALLDVHRAESPLASGEAWTQFAALLLSRYREGRTPLKERSAEPAAVKTVKAYLSEHPHNDTTLERLAQLVQLSPYHLLRSFEEVTGLSPFHYQRQVRLRLAQSVLQQGLSVAQAAGAGGFSNVAELERAFRGTLGMSATTYRAAFR